MSTSGWVFCSLAMPSGAATRHMRRMLVQPFSFTLAMASQAEPPVASMGSTTTAQRRSMSLGSLQ